MPLIQLRGQYLFKKDYNIQSLQAGNCGLNILSEICQDNSGNYYASGIVSNYQNNSPGNNIIVKFNPKGQALWAKINSGNPSAITDLYGDIKIVKDNAQNETGLILAGTHSDLSGIPLKFVQGLQLVKTDLNGNVLFSKNYTTLKGLFGNVLQTKSNSGLYDGFVAAGYELESLNENANSHIVIVKTDDNLNLIWSKRIDLVSNLVNKCFDIYQTHDFGYVITGLTKTSSSADPVIFITRLTAGGNILWTKTYSGLGDNIGLKGKRIVEFPDGDGAYRYMVCGEVKTSNGRSDIFLMETGDNGNLHWFKGIANIYETWGLSISTNQIVLTFRDVETPGLLKLDITASNVLFAKKYCASLGCPRFSNKVCQTSDNGYALTSSEAWFDALHFIKTDNNGTSGCGDSEETLNIYNYSPQTDDLTAVLSTLSESDAGIVMIPATITETVICSNFCDGITPLYETVDIHLCAGNSINLQSPCGNGPVKWYLNNGTTPISTSNALNVSPTSGTVYRADCFNEDGCLIGGKEFNIYVTPFPTYIGESFNVCLGQPLMLTEPPCNGTGTWQPDPTLITGPGLPIASPQQNTSYVYTCNDNFGCPLFLKTFAVTVTPPVTNQITINACEGELIDLTSLYPACSFEEQSLPVTFYASVGFSAIYTCRDASGCISYIDLTVNILPNTPYTVVTSVDCGKTVNLADYSGYCDGQMLWYLTSDITNGVPNPSVYSEIQVINQSTSFTGISVLHPCCKVIVQVNINQKTHYYYFCVKEPFQLDYNIGKMLHCDGSVAWFDMNTGLQVTMVTSTGTYVAKCINGVGCPDEVIFNVTIDENCGTLVWRCQEDGTIYNPCPGGSIFSLRYKGATYYGIVNNYIPITDYGLYEVTCTNGTKTSYFVYPCSGLHRSASPAQETGISENAATVDMDIFPNPNDGHFTLRTKGSSGKAEILIHDVLGKLILKQETGASQSVELDLGVNAKGLYFVTLKNESGVSVRKVTVE